MPKPQSAPRVAAIVGPYMAGKTSLFESLLHVINAIPRKGTIKDSNTVGDSSAEARARQMSVEVSTAFGTYLGDPWAFIDCPGSVEFMQETLNALMVVDAAIVVAEADPNRALMAAPLLKFLDEYKIPHVLFLNKVDNTTNPSKIQEAIQALQPYSERPMVLRQLPIREGDAVKGFIDLPLEKAFLYKAHHACEAVEIPANLSDDVAIARSEMLEGISNFNDVIMEKLLEEKTPSREEVFATFTQAFQADQIVPVLFGSADKDGGIHRLLKLLRHETPEPKVTAARMKIPMDGAEPLAQVWKTLHAQHIGKQSFVRVWRGELADNATYNGNRMSAMLKFFGGVQHKVHTAVVGEVVALGRMDNLKTGDVVSTNHPPQLPWIDSFQPMIALSLKATKSGDEVKLSSSLAKLIEEDPSFRLEQNAETQERILWGQGEIHLKNALEKLKNRFNVEVSSERPQVPYRETIKKGCEVQGRHKRQTGGHGQFGDVHFRIKPLPRGEGIVFDDEIVGGVVPKNYIPAVEDGVRDYCKQGPLGFPVVDLSVILYFGSYHDVDSSDMAFKTAARIGMTDGLVKCSPVLLEPILEIQISVPNEHTSKAQRMVTGHRAGQILGFDAKPGWQGWDVVNAYLPQSEMNDLIIELRSQTMGVGFFSWAFHHLQELEGRDADKIVEARKKALEHN